MYCSLYFGPEALHAIKLLLLLLLLGVVQTLTILHSSHLCTNRSSWLTWWKWKWHGSPWSYLLNGLSHCSHTSVLTRLDSQMLVERDLSLYILTVNKNASLIILVKFVPMMDKNNFMSTDCNVQFVYPTPLS